MIIKKDGEKTDVLSKLKNEDSKKFTKKKSFRLFGILLVVLIAAIALISHFIRTNAASNSSNSTLRTSVARRGEISTSITGSGPVTSANEVNVSSQIASTVKAVYFKEGDTVKAGDLLFELDDTSAQNDVENAENNLLQNNLSNQSTASDIKSLSLTAPFSGQIKNVNAEIGDTKNKNEVLMTLVDTSKLETTLSFTDSGAGYVRVGNSVTIYPQNSAGTLSGKVTFISSSPYSTASGGKIYSIEIEVTNTGSLQEGTSVNAEIDTSKGTIKSIDSEPLKYINQTSIKSSAGGTITAVNARENEFVKKGELLVKLENSDTSNSQLSNDLKTKNLEEQLDDAKKQLSYCKVYAPIGGLITKDNINAGDSVKMGDTAYTIANYDTMQVQIDVDELDIESVKIGQDVSITVDALKETTANPLTGKVTAIAVEGTSNNGVTTYPVTITLDKCENLKGGMNVNAEIFISKKSDVLYVPIEAVIKRGNKNYVMIESDKNTIAQMKKDGTYIDLFSGMGSFGRSSSSSNANNSYGTSNGGSGFTNGQNGNSSRSNNYSNGNSYNGGNSNQNTYGNNSQSSTSSRKSSALSAMSKYKDYYATSYPVEVQLGVNNENSIEITSGLNEGDVVVLPPLTTSSTSTTTSQSSSFRMQGLGGGMSGTGSRNYENSSRN